MALDWRNWGAYNPYWSTTLWCASFRLNDLTLPTGITLVTTAPAHPFAGVAAERVVEFDMSGSHKLILLVNANNLDDGAVSVPPDATKRWAMVNCFDLYLYSGNMPTTDFELFSAEAIPAIYQLDCTSAGLVKFYIDGSLVATSSTALTFDAWQQVEIWHVFNDAAGNPLTTDQWVVRKVTNLTSTIDETTLINVTANSPLSDANTIPTTTTYGSATAEDAGSKMRMCNFAGGWLDADAGWIVNRTELLTPNGIGSVDEWTGTAAAADVDESGNGVPDDATTTDQIDLTASQTKYEHYDMDEPSGYCTTGDTVITMQAFVRVETDAPSKGTFSGLQPLISDGAGTRVVGNDQVSSGADNTLYLTTIIRRRLDPSGSVWTPAGIAGVEMGVKGFVTGTAGCTVKVSTVTGIVLYGKSGETTAAIDAPAASTRRRFAAVI